jgi:hypothetical protein
MPVTSFCYQKATHLNGGNGWSIDVRGSNAVSDNCTTMDADNVVQR